MSFTAEFEKFTLNKLREILASRAMEATVLELAELVEMIEIIEATGVKANTRNFDNRYLWLKIARDFWEDWLWLDAEIEIDAMLDGVKGKHKIDGVIYRGSGLGYHWHNNDFHIDHVSTGLRIWQDFQEEEEARLFIRAMVQVANELGFSWNLPGDEITAKVEALGNVKKKVDNRFANLKDQLMTAA